MAYFIYTKMDVLWYLIKRKITLNYKKEGKRNIKKMSYKL